jgi:hypothetical protein
MKLFDGFLGQFVGLHRDKRKTANTTCVAIPGIIEVLYLTDFLKQCANLIFGRFEADVRYK